VQNETSELLKPRVTIRSINDRVGRDDGDEAMAGVAKQMGLAMRDGDTLARLGGDEFAAIFVDLDDHSRGVVVLGRFLSAVNEPVTVGNQVLNLSVTAGASYYPHTEEVDADLLLRQADLAMYRENYRAVTATWF
jgi:diguanylate cyclase (GGDEF)-like protein